MELTAENVRNIFMDCLFRNEEVKDGKPTVDHIEIDGPRIKLGFHKERVLSHKTEIGKLLMQLPEDFYGKAGAAFLTACNTKHGNQWGEHQNMEQLLTLGMAVELVICTPDEMSAIMPGGMPYYKVIEEIKA